MTEKELEVLVRSSLAAVYTDKHRIVKHHADQYTGAGHADYYGHIMGLHFEMELKVHPNRFTPKQVTALLSVKTSGASAYGLLSLQNNSCWLLYPQQVEHFSYKNNSGWIPVPYFNVPGRTKTRQLLDFRYLETLLRLSLPQPSQLWSPNV